MLNAKVELFDEFARSRDYVYAKKDRSLAKCVRLINEIKELKKHGRV